MNVEETGNPARGRIKVEEDVHSSVHRTSLSEAIPVVRIRPGRPETRRELQRAARDPNIAVNCLTLARGFEFGEPLLAELPTRDTSHSCPGWC